MRKLRANDGCRNKNTGQAVLIRVQYVGVEKNRQQKAQANARVGHNAVCDALFYDDSQNDG